MRGQVNVYPWPISAQRGLLKSDQCDLPEPLSCPIASKCHALNEAPFPISATIIVRNTVLLQPLAANRREFPHTRCHVLADQ
jgi:hypothetical protein